MTDVLGTCTSWGDGRAVVRTEAGGIVEIAIADIVSGKPVPPRASMRDRVPPAGGADARPRVVARPRDRAARCVDAAVVGHEPRPARQLGARDDRPRECRALTTPSSRTTASSGSGRSRRCCRSDEEALFLGAGWGPRAPTATTLFQVASVAHTRRIVRAVPHVRGRPGGGRRPGHRPVGDRAHRSPRGFAAYSGDWVGMRSIEIEPGPPTPGARSRGGRRAARLGSRARRDSRRTSRCSRQRPAGTRVVRPARLPHAPRVPLSRRAFVEWPTEPVGPDNPHEAGARASGVPTRGRRIQDGSAKVWWHRDLAPAHTSRAFAHWRSHEINR